MKKIINIMILLVICLLPVVGNAKANFDYEFKVLDKIFIFEENDIYYFLSFDEFDLYTSMYYLYDKNGNYLGEELIYDSNKMTPDEFLMSERYEALLKIDRFRDDVVFDETEIQYYIVEYDYGNIEKLNPFDGSYTYYSFSDDLEFTNKILGKKFDLYNYLIDKNFYVDSIKQFDDYFIAYYFDSDYNRFCSIMDSTFNDIVIIEDIWFENFYAYIHDNLIYFMLDDKTIEIYKLDGTKFGSLNIEQDFLENDKKYECDAYDLIYFNVSNNDFIIYYVIERCDERFIMNDENDIKNNVNGQRASYITLKYSLNYDVEKVESDNGNFTYETKIDDEGKSFVELKIEPNDGYVVDKIIVTDINGNKIEVTDNKFYKPMNDVKIEVQYKVGEYLPIPDTGLGKSITLILIGFVLISLGFYTINYVRQE